VAIDSNLVKIALAFALLSARGIFSRVRADAEDLGTVEARLAPKRMKAQNSEIADVYGASVRSHLSMAACRRCRGFH
jgi:hypothetical protein